MASPATQHADAASGAPDTPGNFDRDTAVRRRGVTDGDGAPADGDVVLYDAEVSPAWRAGRGPHGGYLAAMLLRALTDAVADPGRTPRSLTIHYARAPQPGPVTIAVTLERKGRSLSTLSARMEQNGRLQALALAAFSVPWRAAEIAELPLPDVAPPDAERMPVKGSHPATPLFLRNLILQLRIGAVPFTGSTAPMEVGAWLGLPRNGQPGPAQPGLPAPAGSAQPGVEKPGLRPLDPPALALFSDALFSPPFVRLPEPAVTPTIDLTIHFRRDLADGFADGIDPDLRELCFARFSSTVVHDGFFEEDGVIWAADGTVLAQSRQLAIVLPFDPSEAAQA
ncbi:MAG TPA: thioesterase family protein [Solirubrobacteraceae bacterium]|nr:thioesterase family protein [Solirubrobacteraceae bacterium]